MPVILSATPYLRSVEKDGKIVPGFTDQALFEALLKRGYVIAILDMRGHGASFGTVYAGGLWGGGDSKRWDLYDVIEWLAVQSWSTGKIGMAGCSYVGLTQFWAANAMPPHLKAIVPCGGSYFDEYSMLRNNGIAQVAVLAGMDQRVWYANDVLHPSPPVDEDKDGALRTTPPLRRDTELTGYPVATLWISSTAQDQDFFVYLEEVDEQGASTLISEGLLRASARATREAPFENEGLPWHSGLMRDQAPLTPGAPAKLEFALFPAAHYLRKGHRIRLTINNYDQGYDTPKIEPAPTVSVYHDAQHPSSITLPLIAAAQGASTLSQ